MANVLVFDNVNVGLRSTIGTVMSETVEALGYYNPGDGGGGNFYWDSGSTDPDDGGVIIDPSGGLSSGRWIRVLKDQISVKCFGASST